MFLGDATAAKKAPVVNGFLTLAANSGANLTITGRCAMEITREVVTVFANPTVNHVVLSGCIREKGLSLREERIT